MLWYCKQDVNLHNENCLKSLGSKVALIRAAHTEKGISCSSDDMNGLEPSMYLAVGAMVMLTSNLNTNVGLCNGAVGIVKEIVYDDGTAPPDLPSFVWVDFGEFYSGESYFDDVQRKSWFPIVPCKAVFAAERSQVSNDYVISTRTMLPLKLAWAWTIWKAQGLTIKHKVVLEISNKEPDHGLTYVAFSRATCLEDIGLKHALSFKRISECIKGHAKVLPRIREESRLLELSVQSRVAYDRLCVLFPIDIEAD